MIRKKNQFSDTKQKDNLYFLNKDNTSSTVMMSRNKSISGSTFSASSSEVELTSYETNPIMVSRSEDELDIDTSDAEIEKIATKYTKRRRHERTKRLIILIGTVVVLFTLTSFTFLRSNKKTSFYNKNDNLDPKKREPSHGSFTHLKSKYIPGYQASMHHFKHTKTQAEFIAFVPMDESQDKTFGISFRTKPTSNNGVAHILEHSVLSGSKNYPAKDPFLHLLKGSLNTFLNAMTYNDRTVYPIASRNSKDFQNLMHVYLDAVFYPMCVQKSGEWVLKQEGWRYDFAKDDNSNHTSETSTTASIPSGRKALEINGVVYSEMKGVFSNPESLLYRQSDKFLFPDNTYFYDSGGEPSEIPTLSQSEFVNFYNKHYHPTNSQIFVSGTIADIESAMQLIDSKYLSNYEANPKIKRDSAIKYQEKHFAHHIYQSIPYAVEIENADEGQHLLLMTWLLNDEEMNQMLELSFYMLDYLLIGTTSSPLNKRLIDSRLGSNVIGGGLSPGLLQTSFAVGMKGVKKFDVTKLEELIVNVLKDVKKHGFAADDIKAAMNSIEFQLKEVHTGSNPLGINVFLGILSKWNYDQDPFSALEYEAALGALKNTVAKEGSKYFVNLIDAYFLENNHRVHLELRPSQTLQQEKESADKNKLVELTQKLSDDDYNKIKGEVEMLEQIQNTDDPQNVVDMIPSLSLDDIDKSGVEYPLDVNENSFGTDTTFVTHTIEGAPGIVYIDVGVDLADVSFSDIGLLPFVNTIFSECNTTSYSREEMDRQIGIHTGGISSEIVLLPIHNVRQRDTFVTETKKMRSYLFFRGKCTIENASKMLELMNEMIRYSVLVSQEKAIALIERKIGQYKSSISSSGHSYSFRRMSARYDVESYFDERLYGVSQLKTLETLLEKATKSWDKFQERLTKIMGVICNINTSGTVINLTGDRSALNAVERDVKKFVMSLKTEGNSVDYGAITHPWIALATKERMEKTSPFQNEGIVVSSQVSYVGKGGRLYNIGDKVSGGNCVPLQYLKKGYLWDEVRAKNGAYGVMAELARSAGTLFMLSYRDPNIVNTLDIYDKAATFLLGQLDNDMISEKDITRAIIGCIGTLDGSALPPRIAGWISFKRYFSNSSAARRQEWRDGILNVKAEDFRFFAHKLKAMKDQTVAIVGSTQNLESANKESSLELETVVAY